MSSLLRAWYAFLALGLVTIALMAVVGRVPFEYSAAVALPRPVASNSRRIQSRRPGVGKTYRTRVVQASGLELLVWTRQMGRT